MSSQHLLEGTRAWRNLARGSPAGRLTSLAGVLRPAGPWAGLHQRLLMLLVSLGWLVLLTQCTSGAALTGNLPIEAPDVANAGDQIAVTIGPVSADNGTPVGLVMLGTYGSRVYRAEFHAGMAHFTIPAEHTLQPGYLALIVAAEEARGEASIILFSTKASTIEYVPDDMPGDNAAAQLSTEQP